MAGYWMHEMSGTLRPVVEKYIRHEEAMSREDWVILRAYLDGWINLPGFFGESVELLRATVRSLRTPREFERWIEAAVDAGCDPL